MKHPSKKLKSELIEENTLLKQRIQKLEKSQSDHKQELDFLKQELNENLLRYNTLIDQSRSIILEWDTDGEILFINNWGLELFGFSKEELIGRNVVGTIVAPADAKGENLVEKMNKVQKAPDEYYSSENENIRKNGEPVWISWTNKGILDQDGKLVKTLSVGIDRTMQHQSEISLIQYRAELEAKVLERTKELQKTIDLRNRELEERKEMNIALRQSEEKYRNLIERATDGIGIVQEGVLCYINQILAQISGYSIVESIGKPFIDFFVPEEVPKVLDRYKRRMAGENVPPVYETALKCKDGSRLDVEVNAGIVTYEGAKADLVFIRDITERK
ncbi:MAG: putative histidine kinase, partial [Deltaproteobacteria bacterium]|nr:putative histidine kinase [Deltaproteobacteria bacterium]